LSLDEFLIGVFFSSLISLFIAVDAHRKRIPTHGADYNVNTGALAWFIGGALILIVIAPMYLFRRNKVLKAREVPTN